MIAYKLLRQLKNGDLTPLFINKTQRIPYNQWMDAECHPTKGFAVRPYWHCTSGPCAPHLSKKGRIWGIVEIEDYSSITRPDNQGGEWFLAKRMKLIGTLFIKE